MIRHKRIVPSGHIYVPTMVYITKLNTRPLSLKGTVMLGYLFEKTTALVSSTVDGVLAVGEYVVDDITSIPQAIEDGWNEGLINTDEEPEEVENAKQTFGA